MKGKKANKVMIGLLIYVCLSATGLTLIKFGLNKNSTLSFNQTGFSLEFSWLLLIGLCMYVFSFLLSLVVMKGMDLSIYYPVSAGAIYIIVCVLGFFVLHEKITTNQLIGMAVILAGIIIMNLGRGN